MTTIDLPFAAPPLSQNQLRRMNHWDEAKAKKTIIATAITAIRRAKTQPVDGPVLVTLHYRPATRRRFDADGLAPTLKCCLDALTRSGLGNGPNVLADDDWTHVPVAAIRVHPPVVGFGSAMWMTLEEAPDAA